MKTPSPTPIRDAADRVPCKKKKKNLVSPQYTIHGGLIKYTVPYAFLPRPHSDDPAAGPILPSKRVVTHADALQHRLAAAGDHLLMMPLEPGSDGGQLCGGTVAKERRRRPVSTEGCRRRFKG